MSDRGYLMENTEAALCWSFQTLGFFQPCHQVIHEFERGHTVDDVVVECDREVQDAAVLHSAIHNCRFSIKRTDANAQRVHAGRQDPAGDAPGRSQ